MAAREDLAMDRHRIGRVFAAAVLVAGVLVPTMGAQADEGCGGGHASSTPGLRVQVTQASKGLRLTSVAHVDAGGTPRASLVLFDRRGLADGGTRIHEFQVHRVALLSDHHTDALSGDDVHEEGVRATVRGAGVLDDGTAVQVWIDVEDRGPGTNVDRARVRIRPLHADHDSHDSDHEDGGCGGEGGGAGGGAWDYRWMTVTQARVSMRPTTP
jgi:hypothetical protein